MNLKPNIYTFPSTDQYAVIHLSLPLNTWHNSIESLVQALSELNPEQSYNRTNVRYKILSSNQFELELVAYHFISQNKQKEQEAHFLGDPSQFLSQHASWVLHPKFNKISVTFMYDGRSKNVVFYKSEFIGTFLDSDEMQLDIDEYYILRIDSNVDLKENEIALDDAWYESGLSTDELPNWLIENSDIYAKGVINFVPEDIQKQNRLKAQIEKYQQSVAVGVVTLVSTLILMLIASFFLSSTQEKLKEEQGYLYNIRSELSRALEINSDLKHQFDTAESQISGRSNHIEAISQYERLLPRSVSIKQLNISAAMGGETLSHSIVATAKDNDDIVLLLKRLNAVDAVQDVSLKKTSNRENGSIQFELDVKYRVSL